MIPEEFSTQVTAGMWEGVASMLTHPVVIGSMVIMLALQFAPLLPKAMASLWGQSKLIGGDPFDAWEDHESLFDGDEAYRKDYNEFRFGRNQKHWEGYYDPDEWHDVKKYRSRNSFLKGD